MALSRRSTGRFQNAIWPGFVDAMTGLLLVLMFVLTIFMVIQFVLRETITGQENQLNDLTNEVEALSSALGLEETRSAGLSSDLGVANAAIEDQASQIISLLSERDAQAEALTAAEGQITSFEAQVAGLLADRDTANATIADLTDERDEAIAEIEGLQAEQDRLATQADALNLALAQARSEIDAQVEQARLAAAQADALQSLVDDLETTAEIDAGRIASLEADNAEQTQQLTALEAQQLAEAAAAEALRERLANADTELTAMTLALEEKRREAEDTLTLLAAADAARADLDTELAALLLAKQAVEAQLADTAEAEVTGNLAVETLQDQLAQAITENQTLQAQIDALTRSQSQSEATESDLAAQLATALAAAQAAREEAESQTTAALSQSEESARQAALLAAANDALSNEQALSAESQRQVALLNAQITQLRQQVGTLQSLLNLAEEEDVAANVQIEALGTQLNTALARVAAEERRARALEEAEADRLALEAARLSVEAQDLERFRSDFFGQLREVLEGQDRVRIEGDRFVFSSEVLFQPGRAELSDLGRAEIANIASILRDIADDIPDGIDWVIRVDGHTDNIPLGGNGRYRDNWELSQGRALSVVRYMTDFLGIPPNRLAANGFGQFQPINTDNTPEARAQNRRIELKLTER
ncbi:peptidoglycan -binding protein [Loktanella sp. F6476L]|uniref:peptidoglycan -binding protein n=1 Tax=Loktanella sp. F6476L TaxID=2926405 RepID=UPI001FF5A94D|nr:peptidoglycan -binding protein [Loktanella sp. F6476L]MCK0121745.1 peptidoglycan -binding protein [Loktanella sp. F6476L]